MAEENIKNKVPANRPKRKPVGTTNRLNVRNKDTANYEYRWVNDTDDRISMFREAGYEVIDPNDADVEQSRIEGGVGADKMVSVGGGTKAVLMRQRKEFYEEDQKVKQDRLDSQLNSIINPNLEGKYGKITVE